MPKLIKFQRTQTAYVEVTIPEEDTCNICGKEIKEGDEVAYLIIGEAFPNPKKPENLVIDPTDLIDEIVVHRSCMFKN